MTKPNARKQLSNIWLVAAEDLMAMTESEIDAELKELGVDPEAAAHKGKSAIEKAIAQSRAARRAQMRSRMEAVRNAPAAPRDPSITGEMARQHIARMQAANDARLTLAARNRDPDQLGDEEALELYWQLQELSR
ncbi:MAG: hypothetical protein AB7I22_21045 [Ramlibacter sp.]